MSGQPTEGTAPEIGSEGLTTSEAAKLFEGLLGGDDDGVELELSGKRNVEAQDDDVVKAGAEGADLDDDEDADAGEGDGEAEGEDSDQEQPDSDHQEPIRTVAELAEALELSQEELAANLKTTIKVNGEELEVTLAELQAGYQKDRDYRQKTEHLAREREAFQETAREVAATYQRESAALAGYLGEVSRIVIGELNGEEMARLRHEDPAEWIARREEYQARLQRLDLIRQAAAQQYEHVQQLGTREQQEALRKTVAEEGEKLKRAIPTWGESEQKVLGKYLIDSGFTADEVSQAYDHRLVVLAWKARQFDESKKVADKIVDKVQQAPKKKLLPPKPPKNPANVHRGKVNQLKGRLKQTGHIKDAAALLEARMG